jgi:GTP-binding protein EngB required for normal cell division
LFYDLRYLYDLLTKGSVVRKKIPLLILCNKTDKVTAHTKEFIRRQLEKEMYGFKSLTLSTFTYLIIQKLLYHIIVLSQLIDNVLPIPFECVFVLGL